MSAYTPNRFFSVHLEERWNMGVQPGEELNANNDEQVVRIGEFNGSML